MTTTMTNANALTGDAQEDARGRLRRWAESGALDSRGKVLPVRAAAESTIAVAIAGWEDVGEHARDTR